MAVMRGLPNHYNEATSNNDNQKDKKVSKQILSLDKKMDELYKDIYISRPDNKFNLDNIIDNLDTAIDKLNTRESDVAGMSELIRRIDSKESSNVSKISKSVQDLFSDQNMITNLFANEEIHNYIAGQNSNYDMICKYLPKLMDALELKRDNVLCSDNFSKDFINPVSTKTNPKDIEQFSSNTKRIETEYNISDFFDKLYMDTSKYGEQFVYVVPYNKAFERIMKHSRYMGNNARMSQVSFFEDTKMTKQTILSEGYYESKDFKDYYTTSIKKASKEDVKLEGKGSNINLSFNESNVINKCVGERYVYLDKKQLKGFKSLFSESVQSVNETKSFKSSSNNFLAGDGLIMPESLLDRDPKIDKDMNGVVLEILPRENVVPIYIGKRCLGYYYLEFAEDKSACGFCGSHHMTPGISNSNKFSYESMESQQELTVRYISSRISSAIDSKFINANKDLKEEIYSILRYNEKFDISRSNDICVTFIPAEDIVHCYFEIDENTHRGISDLQKSLIPAMLYILLYLTDIIGKITRSTDKRIYYVKQNVETNVARTMMNVVQQIKKGNFGMRQVESMNNILNIVGKYNDYIIPTGQSGDPPIQFEVMQGQNIETPTDIMEKMEEAAVNGTGVPLEFVNSSIQQDFATRFTMSNTRFLKSIYTRQRKTEKFLSAIYTRIYNYEFWENNSLVQIILPPPTYLVMNNGGQLFDAITQMTDKIIETEMANESDELKTEFKKIYIRANLGSYLDFASIERYKEQAKVNVETSKIQTTQDGSEAGGDDSSMEEYM